MILNVDDNEISLYTKSRILKRAGFEVKEASTGQEALRLVAREKPDLALLDVHLPDISGLEVCRRIKADPALASVLVLQISASFVEGKDKTRGLEGGADAYLTEPVEPDELVANVKALLRLRQAEEKLRDQEERLRLAFDAATLSAWDWNLTTGRVTWSGHGEQLLGLKSEELTEAGESLLNLVHPEDRERINQALHRSLETFEKFVEEYRVIWPDGSLHWLASTGQVLTDAAGQPVRMIGVVQDISERKQAQEELLHSEAALRASEAKLRSLNQTLEQRVAERTAELERSLKELDQFAYIASHDLKAPLRAIGHLADWIVEDASELLPEPSKAHLMKLRGRISRMETLLNDLLTYSRLDRQYYKGIEPVDTSALVKEIIELLAPPPTFTITVQEEMPTLTTHRIPLELVFGNLIDNAIKHHHRTDGHVSISARDLGDWVEFSVADDGPGIDEAFHERIFQIFQTLQPRDQKEASGMGLAIAQKAVESRGGAITLTSTKGQGTTFRFTWPKNQIL
jgi:PAS domain S-box-containing protein